MHPKTAGIKEKMDLKEEQWRLIFEPDPLGEKHRLFRPDGSQE